LLIVTTDQKGALAEAAMVRAAIGLGFGVLKPLIASERYDLVFDLRPGFVRIQCKWAVLQRGAVVVRCYSSRRSRDGTISRTYAGHEIDAIGAYSAALDSCYVLPFSWIDGRRQVQLRTAPARNNQRAGITLASEFEIEALHWTSYFAGP
jgi:hypothetical protein